MYIYIYIYYFFLYACFEYVDEHLCEHLYEHRYEHRYQHIYEKLNDHGIQEATQVAPPACCASADMFVKNVRNDILGNFVRKCVRRRVRIYLYDI